MVWPIKVGIKVSNYEEGRKVNRHFRKRMKTETVAMILAGGQGSRLGKLTKQIAKPAVPFGGNYRIIDFALSNCANSGY